MRKILIGIPSKTHVNLAMDEFHGLQELGNHCETIVYNRNNSSISKLNKLIGVLLNTFSLIKRLYQFRPDILYLNSRFEPVGSARDFIALFLIKSFYYKSLKIAIKSHGSNFDIFTKKSFTYANLVIPFLVRQVDIWWFLSQDEKRTVEHHNQKMGAKTHVTFNIIDPNRSVQSEEFHKNYDIPKDKFTFLFVGRLVEEKGIFSIVKSIPLFEERDDCIFVFLGDGKASEEIKKLAKKLDVEKYIRFLGFIPEQECDHFFANTDALIFPSHDEGFAMALFKSLASGMPLITTQIRAAKDQLKEPDNCLWVEVGSEKSIAKTLTRLFKNPNLQESMKKNNRLLGVKFTQKSVCQEMQQLFLSSK